MAEIRIFRMKDADVVAALDDIRKAFQGASPAQLTLRLTQQVPTVQVEVPYTSANPALDQILSANAALLESFNLMLTESVSVTVTRKIEGYDTYQINFQQNYDLSKAAKLLAACGRHFRLVDHADATAKLLGEEWAEAARRHEDTVARLHQLAETLIRQNSEYRREVDRETTTLRERLQGDATVARERERAEHEVGIAELKGKEAAFEERVKALDDRRATHARRQIRTDMKSRIEIHEKSFTLSPATVRKRLPIHSLFIVLVGAPLMILGWGLWDVVAHGVRWDGTPNDWVRLLRIPFGAAALAGFLVYYIRWNDRWFSRHADEEFKLKQLDLDVDRASWMVEMMLEWKDEKGSSVPPELIDRLSRNLFTDREDSSRKLVSHPTQDAFSLILQAANSVTIPLPGGAVATLGTKGVRTLDRKSKEGDV